MAASKLFTPQIREKRGDALDRTEEPDMFMNVPMHAEVPSWNAPAGGGNATYPLRMTRDSQQFVKGAQRRRFVAKSERGEY